MLGNVLVTGGAGFIGSQLIKKILPLCNHIYVVDNLSTGKREMVPVSSKVTFIEGSITNTELLEELMPKVENIYHMACSNIIKSVDNIELDFATNLYGGFLMLKCAHQHCLNLKRFVYASTTSVYGDASLVPTKEDYYNITLPYAASKFSTEHYCNVFYHMFGMPVSVLRLSNVFGPGQVSSNPYCGVVAKFFEAINNNESLIIYGDGTQTRDFTFIDDVLEAFLLVAQNDMAIGKVYNIGTGLETSIFSLAREIMKITDYPDELIKFAENRPVDVVKRRNIDASMINRELNWKAKYSLPEGLYKTLQWIKRGE